MFVLRFWARTRFVLWLNGHLLQTVTGCGINFVALPVYCRCSLKSNCSSAETASRWLPYNTGQCPKVVAMASTQAQKQSTSTSVVSGRVVYETCNWLCLWLCWYCFSDCQWSDKRSDCSCLDFYKLFSVRCNFMVLCIWEFMEFCLRNSQMCCKHRFASVAYSWGMSGKFGGLSGKPRLMQQWTSYKPVESSLSSNRVKGTRGSKSSGLPCILVIMLVLEMLVMGLLCLDIEDPRIWLSPVKLYFS